MLVAPFFPSATFEAKDSNDLDATSWVLAVGASGTLVLVATSAAEVTSDGLAVASLALDGHWFEPSFRSD